MSDVRKSIVRTLTAVGHHRRRQLGLLGEEVLELRGGLVVGQPERSSVGHRDFAVHSEGHGPVEVAIVVFQVFVFGFPEVVLRTLVCPPDPHLVWAAALREGVRA